MLSQRTAYLLLIVLTGAAYFGALGNGFVWDDEFLIRSNSYIRNFRYLPQAFTTDLHHGDFPSNFYRPLLTVSFIVDYFFWGLDPFGYHMTNVLLHLVSVLLLFGILGRLPVQSPTLALLVSAIFAVHPINTEAITYISGRSDPLMLAFLLGSLRLFQAGEGAADGNKRIAALLGSYFCFAGALFSREAAMIYPVLLLWFVYVFQHQAHPRWWKPTLPFFAITVLFLVWRTHVLFSEGTAIFPESLPLGQRLVFALRALAGYIGIFFWPAHLQMERTVIGSGWPMRTLTLAGALAVYIWIFAMILSRRRLPLVCFGLGWFAIGWLPISGIFNLNATMAEHWMHLPSIGFYLAVVAGIAELLRRFPQFSPVAAATAAMVLVLLVLRTNLRNSDWVDSTTFYQKTAAAAPLSTRVQNNLVHRLIMEGQGEAAIEKLQRAVLITNVASIRLALLSNLGYAHLQLGNYEQARLYLEQTIDLNPSRPEPYFSLATLYKRLQRPSEAEATLRAALQACPRSWAARAQFALFLAEQDRFEEAEEQFQLALAREPFNARIHNLLGYAYYRQKNFPQARAAFERAAALDRHSPDALLNLGLLHRELGDAAATEDALSRAVARAPRDPQTHFRLALFYWQQRDWPRAAAAAAETARLSPQSRMAKFVAQQISSRTDLSTALTKQPELEQEGLSLQIPAPDPLSPSP